MAKKEPLYPHIPKNKAIASDLKVELNRAEFDFTSRLIADMVDLIRRTKVRERSFALCQTKEGEIIAGKEHMGGEYGGELWLDCPNTTTPVGSYHTHPKSEAEPSWNDIYALLVATNKQREKLVLCQGAKEDGRIVCEMAKDIPSKAKLDYFWKGDEDIGEMYNWVTTPKTIVGGKNG